MRRRTRYWHLSRWTEKVVMPRSHTGSAEIDEPVDMPLALLLWHPIIFKNLSRAFCNCCLAHICTSTCTVGLEILHDSRERQRDCQFRIQFELKSIIFPRSDSFYKNQSANKKFTLKEKRLFICFYLFLAFCVGIMVD